MITVGLLAAAISYLVGLFGERFQHQYRALLPLLEQQSVLALLALTARRSGIRISGCG